MKKFFFTLVVISVITPKIVLADIENWYSYWAIGLASHNHPSDIKNIIDAAESIPGVERSQGAIDMFGFYWPIDNNTIGGFVISGSFDRLTDRFDDYFQINQYLYGASGMHFFGEEIGDGFFLRGDIGLARSTFQSNFLSNDESDFGKGYLFGVGYGIPISWNTRFLISVNYSNKTIEGDNYASTSITVGGLW